MLKASLRVGCLNLSEREATLLRSLVKLNALSRQGMHWEFVDHAPYDLVFIDPIHPDNELSASLPPSTPIVKVVNELPVGKSHSIQRPIKSIELVYWLDQARMHAEKKYDQLLKPTPPKQAAPESASSLTTAQFRLNAWPPSIILRADTLRIRLATILISRAMSVDELSQATELPGEHIELFIKDLQRVNLLTVIQINRIVPAKTAQIGNVTLAIQKIVAPSSVRSLMAQIRQKLGLFKLA
jgi:hypothetical protein